MAKAKGKIPTTISSFTGTYEWLSNFYMEQFYVPRYVTNVPSAEHLYQMMKASTMADAELVLAQPTAGLAKKKGRSIAVVHGWEAGIRVQAMQYTLLCKFNNVRPLGQRTPMTLGMRLVSTGDLLLIEGNKHHDNFWGDCNCGKKTECATPGKNMLGELLMARRAELQEQMP